MSTYTRTVRNCHKNDVITWKLNIPTYTENGVSKPCYTYDVETTGSVEVGVSDTTIDIPNLQGVTRDMPLFGTITPHPAEMVITVKKYDSEGNVIEVQSGNSNFMSATYGQYMFGDIGDEENPNGVKTIEWEISSTGYQTKKGKKSNIIVLKSSNTYLIQESVTLTKLSYNLYMVKVINMKDTDKVLNGTLIPVYDTEDNSLLYYVIQINSCKIGDSIKIQFMRGTEIHPENYNVTSTVINNSQNNQFTYVFDFDKCEWQDEVDGSESDS